MTASSSFLFQRHSYMEEDDAEKHDVATLLISLSPQRTKSTSHVTPDVSQTMFWSDIIAFAFVQRSLESCHTYLGSI